MTHTPEEIIAFCDLMEHYSLVQEVITPKTAFMFLRHFIEALNPFENPSLLRQFITDLQASGIRKGYLSNDFIDANSSALYQKLWTEVAAEKQKPVPKNQLIKVN